MADTDALPDGMVEAVDDLATDLEQMATVLENEADASERIADGVERLEALAEDSGIDEPAPVNPEEYRDNAEAALELADVYRTLSDTLTTSDDPEEVRAAIDIAADLCEPERHQTDE